MHPVGADDAGLDPARLQHALDEVGNGGLALGAGDADDGQLLGRVPEQVAGHDGQSRPAVFYQGHRRVFGQGQGPLGHE